MNDVLDILKLVIQTMETTERVTTLPNGEAKRDVVLTYLKQHLTQYDKYEKVIVIMIEVVILLSRTKLLINVKKKCNLICS